MKERKNKQDEKEDFCPPCLLAAPIAFAVSGVGVSEIMDGSTDKSKNFKTILLWSSVGIGVVSLALFIYFKFIKKCSTCK